MLNAEEQRLLAQLSVFVGGWTLEAAETVFHVGVEPTGDALAGLASLADKSLVQAVEVSARFEEEGPRFTMLETIRDFALERLAESGSGEDVRQVHAAFYVTLAETAEPLLQGPQQTIWLERLDTEYANLRRAMDWTLHRGDIDNALRLVSALWLFWLLRGYHHEAHLWVQAALAHPAAARPTAIRAKTLNAAGATALMRLEPAAALPVLEEALALSRDVGDPHLIAKSLQLLGAVAGTLGDYARGDAFLEQSLAMWYELDDTWNRALTLYHLAAHPLVAGQDARAEALYEESVRLFNAAGDARMVTNPLRRLGHLALRQGDPVQAGVRYRESLSHSRDLADTRGLLASVVALAAVAASHGQVTEAVRLCGAVTALVRTFEINLFPLDQAVADGLVSELRSQLEGSTFEAAWTEGCAMSLEEAVGCSSRIG